MGTLLKNLGLVVNESGPVSVAEGIGGAVIVIVAVLILIFGVYGIVRTING